MKTIIKRIVAIALAICLFIAGAEFWKYILISDSTSYTRLMMHQLYNPEDNIDVLFVGSSHVYRAFIPKITDKEFGAYTFNAGSSGQFMDGSLAVIKEADKGNDIKHVFLELYYDVVSGGTYEERTGLTSTYILSDYMPMSLNKIQFLTHASSKEYWINSFLIAKRNWINFFDSNYVKNVILSKQTEEYKNYIYPKKDGDIEYYVDRGFVANDTEVGNDIYFNSTAYGEIEMGTVITKDSDWYKSLTDIISYCKKQNIELTLFITPEPEWTLVGKGNYQEYHEFISEIANEYGLDFYDFNLCKNEYLDTNDRTLFKDEDHLNTKGAELFSALSGDVFTKRLSKEEVLYNSFTEKIAAEDIAFYGISGPKACDDGSRSYKIITGSNHYEYQVIETKEDGSQIVLLDFAEEKEFSLPAGDTGILTVICKDKQSDEVFVTEFEF